MFLSVQSPTEAAGCTFPKHSFSKPTVPLLNNWHSQQGLKQCWRTTGKAWILRLVVWTLYFGALVHLSYDQCGPCAISLENESRTPRSDRAGKTRMTLLEMRTALLETPMAQSTRVYVKNNFVAAKERNLYYSGFSHDELPQSPTYSESKGRKFTLIANK